MSDSQPNPARPVPTWQYALFSALGGVLAAGGLVLMSLQFAIPGVRGLTGLGAACVTVAAVTIAAMDGRRGRDRMMRELARISATVRRLDEGRVDEKLAQEIGDLSERVMHLTDRADLAMEAAKRQRDWVDTVVAGLVREIAKLADVIERAPREAQDVRVLTTDLFEQAMQEIRGAGLFEISERLDEFQGRVDEKLAAFAVEIFRTQDAGTVVALPARRQDR